MRVLTNYDQFYSKRLNGSTLVHNFGLNPYAHRLLGWIEQRVQPKIPAYTTTPRASIYSIQRVPTILDVE